MIQSWLYANFKEPPASGGRGEEEPRLVLPLWAPNLAGLAYKVKHSSRGLSSLYAPALVLQKPLDFCTLISEINMTLLFWCIY